jgi:hypothetical protein
VGGCSIIADKVLRVIRVTFAITSPFPSFVNARLTAEIVTVYDPMNHMPAIESKNPA